MGCYLPLDQQLRQLKWERCQLRKTTTTTDVKWEIDVTTDDGNPMKAGTTKVKIPARVKSDSIKVSLDGVGGLLRNRSDRISYLTPIYGSTETYLYFNQAFEAGQIYSIEYTFYNLPE
jgi:hypothetical protein